MLDRINPYSPIRVEDINQVIDVLNKPITPTVNGFINSNGQFYQEPIQMPYSPYTTTYFISGVRKFGLSGNPTDEVYSASGVELVSDLENGLAEQPGSLDFNTMIIRELNDNPTASMHISQVHLMNQISGIETYGYKATASVAPVYIMSGTTPAHYMAAWQRYNSGGWSNVPSISDTVSGNIIVHNLGEDNYSTDYSMFYSGVSGDQSGTPFNCWAQKISDVWVIDKNPHPIVSGMEVWDIDTQQHIIVAATDLYQVWQSNSGDENNYAYGFDYPRLADI